MKALPLIPGQLYIVVNCKTLDSEKVQAVNGAHAIAEYIKRNFDITEVVLRTLKKSKHLYMNS